MLSSQLIKADDSQLCGNAQFVAHHQVPSWLGQGLINDEPEYREEVEQLIDWCRIHNLNVDTAKEMTVGFRRACSDHSAPQSSLVFPSFPSMSCRDRGEHPSQKHENTHLNRSPMNKLTLYLLFIYLYVCLYAFLYPIFDSITWHYYSLPHKSLDLCTFTCC